MIKIELYIKKITFTVAYPCEKQLLLKSTSSQNSQLKSTKCGKSRIQVSYFGLSHFFPENCDFSTFPAFYKYRDSYFGGKLRQSLFCDKVNFEAASFPQGMQCIFNMQVCKVYLWVEL